MSHGNLEGKLVAHDFWPGCANCVHCATCKVRPRHPAYPHSWHWGRECAAFPEGTLVVQSWVGTSVIGQPHTGCLSYTVDPRHVAELAARHQHYLALQREQEGLDATLARLVRVAVVNPRQTATAAVNSLPGVPVNGGGVVQ